MIVTLTTDFGLAGPYVAEMKGALLSRAPGATVVDITHALPAHDIAAGAFVMARACGWFPAGTVHIGVVDPGVGTARRGLVARGPDHIFVGPDNGLFTLLADAGKITSWWEIETGSFAFRPSATFHGRDLFVPVAAALLAGMPSSHTGPPLHDPVRLPLPAPQRKGATVTARVLDVDTFGNVTTNLRKDDPVLAGAGAPDLADAPGTPIVRTYAEGPAGRPFLLWGSADYLEIACDRSSAAARLGLAPGDDVVFLLNRPGGSRPRGPAPRSGPRPVPTARGTARRR